MLIETLTLRHFRNYDALEMHPHPGVNLLFGHNGSGKTNLLEAIHYCALGRSHRTASDREVVQRGEEQGACGVTVQARVGRCSVAVLLTPQEARRKQVLIDRKRAARLSDLMGRVRCVIFSPEDLLLVREGPSCRRRFADMMLSQLSPGYFVALQQYQKALEQRNALLREQKRSGVRQDALLDAFETVMADMCAQIIPMRRRLISRTAALAAEKYAAISGREGEEFAMRYASCLEGEEDLATRAKSRLEQSRQDDALRGATLFGVHREDIALTLCGREMKQFASQGQIRTACLSMKLSQLALYREECGESPVLLLDDVMSELDMNRRTRLLREIEGVQTFVTCTDESDLEGAYQRRSYRVSLDDKLRGSLQETSAGERQTPCPQEADEPDFT